MAFLTDKKLKALVSRMIDESDQVLGRPRSSNGSTRRPSIALRICEAQPELDRSDAGRVAKIILAKAQSGQIDLYMGDQVVLPEYIDVESVGRASHLEKRYGVPSAPEPPIEVVAQVEQPVAESKPQAEPARDRWSPQHTLMRDIVFWFLWQQPGYEYRAERVSRRLILETAGYDGGDKGMLQALSSILLLLEERGYIHRELNKTSTKLLRLLVELDDETVEGLRSRFSQPPTRVAPEVEPEVKPAIGESVEEIVRRVCKEELDKAVPYLIEETFKAIRDAFQASALPTD
jgi:hypothetical protein